jgi:hypothetical protein
VKEVPVLGGTEITKEKKDDSQIETHVAESNEISAHKRVKQPEILQ